MKINKTAVITTLVCLVPVIVGIILYPQLPDEIVTHWDANGVPNGWSSKFTGAIVFPGALVLVNIIFPLLLKVDPRYSNIGDKVKTLIQWIIPIISIFASSSTLAAALGYDAKITLTGPVLLGFVFILIGNFMPKMQQTYTVGIKLPWTLDSEENWNRTHRMAGGIWVVCGFAIIALAFIPGGKYFIAVPVIAMIAIPTIYSYMLFKKGI